MFSTTFSKKNISRFMLLGMGIGAFLFFILFSYIVHHNHFTQFDFDMTVRLQDHISRRFDSWFSYLSTLGSFEPMTILLAVLLVARRKILGIFTFGFFGFLHLFEIYGKTFVNHLPPPEFMVRTQHLIQLPQFNVRLQNSYPSGHMGRALFMTTFLGVIAVKTTKLNLTQKIFVIFILAIYDITMGISRIYLGEHWTSDVLGGAVLGLSMGLFAAILL